MAPLPPNTTRRVFFDYITGNDANSREHTFSIRVAEEGTLEGAQQLAANFLTALGTNAFHAGWRVIRVRDQAAGSDFSFPQTVLPALAAFVGVYATQYSPRFETVEDTFQGRGTQSGRRVDLSLYRAHSDADPSFRVETGASGFASNLATAIGLLNTASASGDYAVTIDGSPAVWYPYMNQNYNSYWEGRTRLG